MTEEDEDESFALLSIASREREWHAATGTIWAFPTEAALICFYDATTKNPLLAKAVSRRCWVAIAGGTLVGGGTFLRSGEKAPDAHGVPCTELQERWQALMPKYRRRGIYTAVISILESGRTDECYSITPDRIHSPPMETWWAKNKGKRS
jgi:hypothetical protein